MTWKMPASSTKPACARLPFPFNAFYDMTVSQVERGFSHAMIYTSKIIDLDEERSTGAAQAMLQKC